MGQIFRTYCADAIKILNARFQASKLVKHGAAAGAIREQLIRDFLSEHLPELIAVRSGLIIDSTDQYSKQQDLVLVIRNMPRLPFASDQDLIFQEAVIAVLEIKTSLNAVVLNQIGENISSVRALKSNAFASVQMGVSLPWPANRIFTGIITYGGSSEVSIERTLEFMKEEQRPDVVLDLTRGMHVINDGILMPSSDRKYSHVKTPEEGFREFLLYLVEITGVLAARGVDWRAY